MKIINKLLLPTVCFVLIVTCKKDSVTDLYNTLPPITQQGAGTFGCMVNGKVWLPLCSLESPGIGCAMSYALWPNYLGRLTTGGVPIFFNLSTRQIENGIATKFEISFQYLGSNFFTVPGDYSKVFDFDCVKTDNKSYFNIYHTNTGGRLPNINFTATKVDTANHFVSGLFSFTLYLNNSANIAVDSIVVTDGRFDLPFTQDTCICTPN